ncbi:MAG: hypothetical protein H6624_10940 [Bdellovibrionaceae bacterium]|nr:hypothetical protein [Pseudobdellovibrionaceae bacterium]
MAARKLIGFCPFLIFLALGVLGFVSRGLAADNECPQEKAEHDLIFQGRIGFPVTVIDSPFVKSHTKPDEAYENVGFYETKIWKGEFRPQEPYNAIPIRTGVKNSYKFPKSDDTYLVYATKMKDGSYFVHRCSPTKLASLVEEITKTLGRPIYEERNPYYKLADLGLIFKQRNNQTDGWPEINSYWKSYVERYRRTHYSVAPCAEQSKVDVVFVGKAMVEIKKNFGEERSSSGVQSSRYQNPFYPWSLVDGVDFSNLELYKDVEGRFLSKLDLRPGPDPGGWKVGSGKKQPLAWRNPFFRLKRIDRDSYEFARVDSSYYLVRGAWDANGEFYIDRCSGTQPIESVSKEELRNLGAPLFRASRCWSCNKTEQSATKNK